MRLFIRIILVFILLSLIVLTGLHIFVTIRGKELLTNKLHSVFKEDIRIGSVSTGFPFDLAVMDVQIEDRIRIKEVFVGMGLIDLLRRGDFVLSDLKLRSPQLTLERKPHPAESPDAGAAAASEQNAAVQPPQTVTQSPAKAQPQKSALSSARKVTIKKILIEDGMLTFVDRTQPEKPVTIVIKDIDAAFENFHWPLKNPQVMSFKLSGKMPWKNISEAGTIRAEGWINFARRDMRAKAEIKDIDALYIGPYYRDWIDIEKARVAKARLNFTTDITSLKNDVNALCHLELTQIEFKAKGGAEESSRLEKITQAVLGMFKALNQGRIMLDFTFKTKFDNPEFACGTIKDAVSDKVKEARKDEPSSAEKIIKLPGKLIEGTISSAADLTKSVINGTVSIGKELGKAVGVSFDRGAYTNTTAEPQAAPQAPAVNQTTTQTNTTNTAPANATSPTNTTQ